MMNAKPASVDASTAATTKTAATKTDTVIEQAKKLLLQNYKQQPIVLERGDGCFVWDVEGKRYLDLLGGIATCALGHCHPDVVAAAKAQLDKLWHVSNVFYSEPQIQLAARLTSASGLAGARAFFCNSGAEANEALIKLARRYHHDAGNKVRNEIITFENSFHGRTLATVTATAQPKYQQGFEPLPQGFHYAPVDLEAVKRMVTERTAAILIEPIQGEGGVRPLPAGFLKALRTLCDEQGILLLLDEVQTGIGRTGKPFAYQHEGVLPDAFSLAKALGNGLPIGAMVCTDVVSKALPSGSHGSTFGGNLVAAAAACAAWDIAMAPAMLAEISEKGAVMLELFKGIQSRHPERVKDVRGRGLLAGIEVNDGAGDVIARCRANGLLVNLAGEKTIRFAPAYVVTREQLSEGAALFERSL